MDDMIFACQEQSICWQVDQGEVRREKDENLVNIKIGEEQERKGGRERERER